MAVDRGTFETLAPSRFICFSIPNPLSTRTVHSLYGDFLRIAVLDSPVQIPGSPQIAAMLVPKDREEDWIFSTETGHLQLLLSCPGISRLILAGNPPCGGDYFPPGYNRPACDLTKYRAKFEESLTPLLLALSPKACFINCLPQIPFVAYEDNVIRSLLVERCVGCCAGEMLVEDVEIEHRDVSDRSPTREFRRRLRFKRIPNLIQTEVRITPDPEADSTNIGLDEVKFRPETGILVHPYLAPMVASLSLIAPYLEERVQSGSKPRVLCVGVGGGALLTFLNTHFGFEVMGVEADETVLRIARQHFGLVDGEFLRVHVGDGIEVMEKFACQVVHQNSGSAAMVDIQSDQCLDIFDGRYTLMDVIMVDLDSSDIKNGITAPPLQFVGKKVLLAVKSILHKLGILVINVIPPSRPFYDWLVHEFREIFAELYEIDVGNGENYVLIAAASPIGIVMKGQGDLILKKLKLVLAGAYMDSIKKI